MDQREPCPWRIVDDCGGAFAMGAIGGSIFHGIKGFKNAPIGYRSRLVSAFQTVHRRAPRTGAAFAAWGAMFSAIDCSVVYMRQREDPWNSIIAGAATGGLVAIRQGTSMIVSSSIVGGILLAAIEGVGIVFNRYSAHLMQQQQQAASQQQQQ